MISIFVAVGRFDHVELTRMIARLTRVIAATAMLVCPVLTGCADVRSDTGSDRIAVTASTDVWASVTKAVGGDAVTAKALVSGTNTDPHSHESTPADAAEVAGADLVVVNGGGYDTFMDKILGSVGTKRTVQVTEVAKSIDAAFAPPSAARGTGGGVSTEHGKEHYWYDLPTTSRTAERIAEALGEIRPAARDTFRNNAKSFVDELGRIEQQVDALATRARGAKVVMSEPVAAYLATRAQLTDVTPSAFAQAVEEGTDPPVAAVAEIGRLVESHEAAVLIHNPQTETPVTRTLREKAQAANVPVVEMSETLPERKDYLSWMTDNVSRLTGALTRS
jgi:zinc/manganese transport system substrate-binding protein